MDHPADSAASDTRLAEAWERGDEHGYDALVARYAPVVYARCRRALGTVDADDATQAVFLVLARKRAQAAASPALAAWLLTVTDNVLRVEYPVRTCYNGPKCYIALQAGGKGYPELARTEAFTVEP